MPSGRTHPFLFSEILLIFRVSDFRDHIVFPGRARRSIWQPHSTPKTITHIHRIYSKYLDNPTHLPDRFSLVSFFILITEGLFVTFRCKL